jgi:UDP-glucose 4-epimerase
MSTYNSLKSIKGIQRVIILGNTGFIGRHLERFFHSNSPEIEVIGKSLPSVDLTKEEDVLSLKEIFDMKTVVIMFSAIKRDFGDNLDTFSKNLKMIVNICKVLQERPVRHFIYFSSTAVYGEDINNTNITEKTPVYPTSYYGMAKYASERLLWKAFEPQKQCSLLILRPPVIYGPGEAIKTYSPSGFIRAILNKEQITLWGGGEEKREFIFIGDVVKLVHHLTFHEYSGVLNIASGKSYTFKGSIETISGLMGDINVDSRERTKRKVDHVFSNNLFVELLPNFHFTSLEEGVKHTFDFESKKTKEEN